MIKKTLFSDFNHYKSTRKNTVKMVKKTKSKGRENDDVKLDPIVEKMRTRVVLTEDSVKFVRCNEVEVQV